MRLSLAVRRLVSIRIKWNAANLKLPTQWIAPGWRHGLSVPIATRCTCCFHTSVLESGFWSLQRRQHGGQKVPRHRVTKSGRAIVTDMTASQPQTLAATKPKLEPVKLSRHYSHTALQGSVRNGTHHPTRLLYVQESMAETLQCLDGCFGHTGCGTYDDLFDLVSATGFLAILSYIRKAVSLATAS